MTRKNLAKQSTVSERYLAQLEGGRGNPSILVLARVAQAMNCPIEDLVSNQLERPAEYRLLTALLERLGPTEMTEARALLSQKFGAHADAGETLRIAFIGLRGAGKSTLGKRLADALKIPFIELNTLVEQEYGAPVGEILELSGQSTYRRYERRVLENIFSVYKRIVIATGGGIVTEPATYDLLLRHTLTVWIKASPEEHMARVIAQGDLRPMADNREAMEDLKHILAARTPFYAQAHLNLDTSGKSENESLQDILRLVSTKAR